VVNSTGWLTDQQIESITVCEPLTQGEGIVFADLDMALITKRKRMMDSVGHYARPELLSLMQQGQTDLNHFFEQDKTPSQGELQQTQVSNGKATV